MTTQTPTKKKCLPSIRVLRARYEKAREENRRLKMENWSLRARHASRAEEINLLMGALRQMRERLKALQS